MMLYGPEVGHKYVFVATHISLLLKSEETYDFLQKLKHSTMEELNDWYGLLHEEVLKCQTKRSTRTTRKSKNLKG